MLKRRRKKNALEVPGQSPLTDPIKLPQALEILLRSSTIVRSNILHRLPDAILSFYKNILQQYYCQLPIVDGKQQHKQQFQQQKCCLILLREIVYIQKNKIAARTIQRQVRLFVVRVKKYHALTIQCWFRQTQAVAKAKLSKAVKFLNRLTQHNLLKVLIKWHQEVQLLIYKRNNVGPKSLIFQRWLTYANNILQFKQKIRSKWLKTYGHPMLKGWRIYKNKAQSVRTFVLRIVMGQKKQCFDRIVFLVTATTNSLTLQCWVRCINAKIALRKLKIHQISQHIATRSVHSAGKLATVEFQRRGAVAVQKIFRSYSDRLYCKDYRQERLREFAQTNKKWKTAVRLAGILAIRKTLNKLNKNVFGLQHRSTKVQTSKAQQNTKRHRWLPPLVKNRERDRDGDKDREEERGHTTGLTFAQKCFRSVDTHNVGIVPVTAAKILFQNAGLHMSKSEFDLNANLLSGSDGHISIATFEAFLKSGVIYEASNTPKQLHVGAFAKIIRGQQLHSIRMLRGLSGESTKRLEEREQLREAQLKAQLCVWETTPLSPIYCLHW